MIDGTTSIHLSEFDLMRNPALGAVLMWRFACGFAPARTAATGAPLPLLYYVIPIVLHRRTREELLATKVSSGARQFAFKFAEHKHSDDLLAIQTLALENRTLSHRALQVALYTKLISMNPAEATILPLDYRLPKSIPLPQRALIGAAERLGKWCSSLSLYEIGRTLRIAF